MIWGTTWAVMKISLNEGTPPFYGAGMRFLLAGIIVFILLFAKKEPLPKSRAQWKMILQFSLINFTLCYALSYWATQYVFSSVASLLWASFPLGVAVLSHFKLPNEKLTRLRAGSVGLGSLGAVLIIGRLDELGAGNSLPAVMIILAAVILATFPNIRLKQNAGLVSSLQLNSIGQTLAGIIILILSALTESDLSMVWSKVNILSLAYLTVFGSLFTWLIYVWLFEHITMNQIAYIAFFPPMIATGVGWIFLGEQLTFQALAGGILIVTGAVIINLPAVQKNNR